MEKVEQVKSKFIRICQNEYPSCTEEDGVKKVMLYKRTDLYHLAKEAFAQGQDYFYAIINDKNQAIKSEPIYIYGAILTQKEYDELFK